MSKITKTIKIDDKDLFGENIFRVMAGPCAVESRDQILYTADKLSKLGIEIFRAGTFKPRVDPETYQGAREQGLIWLAEARKDFGLKIITETTDLSNFDLVEEYSDIIQIGAKAMYNPALLTKAGKSSKAVLLKRHFGATVDEYLKMLKYITKEGNNSVILCERGIRTFETSSRFTLDLCGGAVIQERTDFPLVIDPSHSMGHSYGVPKLSRAAVAFGAGGLLIEVHHDPKNALCDSQQALNIDEFAKLYKEMKAIGETMGITVK